MNRIVNVQLRMARPYLAPEDLPVEEVGADRVGRVRTGR